MKHWQMLNHSNSTFWYMNFNPVDSLIVQSLLKKQNNNNNDDDDDDDGDNNNDSNDNNNYYNANKKYLDYGCNKCI